MEMFKTFPIKQSICFCLCMWISKPVSKFSFLGLILINVQFAGRLFELNNLP